MVVERWMLIQHPREITTTSDICTGWYTTIDVTGKTNRSLQRAGVDLEFRALVRAPAKPLLGPMLNFTTN